MADSGTIRDSGVRLCRDAEGIAWEAAGIFAKLANEHFDSRRRFTVALSGGQTPRKTYELLAGTDFRDKVPWERVHVFWGDERAVRSDHPDSNYRMVWEALLSKVDIPVKNIHPVKTEEGPPKTVSAQYDRHLQEFFRLVPGHMPVFDLVLLGLGPDGHTASLFPGNEALDEKERLFINCFVEKIRSQRYTMTLPVMNNANQVVFLVSGVEKANIFKQVIEGADPARYYPAAQVQPASGNLLWLVDEAAASRLSASTLMKAQRSTGR